MNFLSAVSALFGEAPELAQAFRTQETYLIGGAVRDMLKGCRPIDYDIVVRQDPEVISLAISRITGAHFFKMGKGPQSVLRGHVHEYTIDLVRMAGDSIESDLRLRDFTINAMAVHLGNGSFLDPMLGQEDLARRTLRMVSEESFPSDPLRMLRAYRFAASLNFDIEAATESAIRTHSRLIRRTAGERIREELLRLLAAPCATQFLWKMKDSGLLFDLFPELVDEKGCSQNHYHCFDVLDHTLFACKHLESFLGGLATAADPMLHKAINGIEDRLKPLLKLTMLLHDLGKPSTRTEDAAGSVHFFGHEDAGATLCEAISSRLKLSKQAGDYLCGLVQNHLRPFLLYPAYQNRSLTHKARIRLFRVVDACTPELMIMALADARAKTEHVLDPDPSFTGFIADLLKTYYQAYLPEKNKAPLITGRDLITLFGLRPGPVFKTILEAVEEARLSQTLVSQEEACAWIRTWLEKRPLSKPKKD